jgi:hypothetical protein
VGRHKLDLGWYIDRFCLNKLMNTRVSAYLGFKMWRLCDESEEYSLLLSIRLFMQVYRKLFFVLAKAFLSGS